MSKSVFKSKMFWWGLLTALSPLHPGFDGWIKGNEVLFVSVWGTITTLLRFITRDKVVLIK